MILSYALMRATRPVSLLVAGLAVALGVVAGCGTRFQPVSAGTLATPGVRIANPMIGLDVMGGQQFSPPFSTECHRIRNLGRDPLVQQYEQARLRGAQNVQVFLEGNPVPYTGVLALCEVARGSHAPGARSYELRVDPEYVAAASGGRISVMFETYPNGSDNLYSWILWLSDRTF